MSSSFPIENGLKQGDALLQPFNFALEYAIRKVQETNLGLDMNDYVDDVNIIGNNVRIERNTDVLLMFVRILV